ncbi:unnamed protein product [Coregonus sp. 'balchen']|nr:unnamed protein product [Coregonus sp. 'balchen']
MFLNYRAWSVKWNPHKMMGAPLHFSAILVKKRPEHINVCFWVIPRSLKNKPPDPESNRRLHEVAPKIKANMMEHGMTMIGYQPLRD